MKTNFTASKQRRNEAAARRAANTFGERYKEPQPLDIRGFVLHDGRSERSEMPYRMYLQTRHWQIARKTALKQANYRCANCGDGRKLRVHHLTYENLWCEYSNDVTVLCDTCHNMLHDLFI